MDIPQFIEKWLRQQTFSSFSNKASIQPNQNTAELTSHDIQLLLTHLECAEWLKLPKKAPVPTNPEEVQVIQRLKHTQEWIRKYHDNPVNQEAARNVIPFDLLSERADKRVSLANKKGKKLEMDQAFILETLDWFKKSFFTWVDRIPCNFCNPSNDILIVAGSITMEERQRGVTRVELHECRHCHRSNRFPRLHSPIDVLNARRGRCGEWANAFLLIGKALGYETRYVMDWADHVWNEIKIPSLQRWVHVDVCENLMDAPMVYCLGWKKKLQRVYSIDGGYVMDVFDRYTKNETKPIKSPWLKRAEQQLCAYGLYFTSNKLACLMEQAYAYLDYQQTITSDSLQTRKSGDEQWKASRGECRTFPTHLSYLKPIQLTTCNLVGNARCIVDTLELTSNRTDQCGGTWLPQVLVPTESFCIEWTMQITGNGADGLAFVIQGVSIEALGEGGCGLGYAGIPRSLAIEFDTFYSPEQGDPDENHVSIQSCLKEPNSSHHEFSLGCFPFPVDLNEGVPIHVRILYEHGGQFSIWNQTSNQVWKELFTFHFPLKNLCDENTALYLGFTAATGGIAQRHVIQQIQFLKLN